ncbi:MAG: carboxypeptidase-like regulatory domain-containing protein [Dysgonamonadaceae bacterium]|jgi:hypothetical protein|nr:carboxypeptidase-like regulatory domain-containing protein [Dysgonamonadaceae bacterium]
MRIHHYLLAFCVFCIVLSGCNRDDEIQNQTYPFSGYIIDSETGSNIQGAEIELLSENGKYKAISNQVGYYEFFAVAGGKYKLTVSHYNYESEIDEITIARPKETHTKTLHLAKSDKPNAGIVNYIALNNGVAFQFEKSEKTDVFYWNLFYTDFLKNYTDKKIIESLLSGGNEVILGATNENTYYDISYQMEPEINYTIFVIGLNRKGEQGNLYRLDFKTKSKVNQPVADIVANAVSPNSLKIDIRKNQFCKKFCFAGYYVANEDLFHYPDSYFALYFLESPYYHEEDVRDKVLDFDFTGEFANFEGLIFVTLGFDEKGNNGGVISKTAYSKTTNSVVNLKNTFRSDSKNGESFSFDQFVKSIKSSHNRNRIFK